MDKFWYQHASAFHSKDNKKSQGSSAEFISTETRGNASPMVKVFKKRIMDGTATIFWQKRTRMQDPHISAPDAWTKSPISAWLASVPTVRVLQNNH